ncbi:unnamed protein product [Caenorhabditis sp. 36 PRJEB53466]|nr:unnamed protein product [Caenorhabditis sp. 36 PRJEB53466]
MMHYTFAPIATCVYVPVYHVVPVIPVHNPVPVFEPVNEKLLLNAEQLFNFGFPCVVFGNVVIKENEFQRNRNMFYAQNDRIRVCTRCQYAYQVASDGHQRRADSIVCMSRNGEFNYHITDQQPEEKLKMFVRAPKVSLHNEHQSDRLFAIDVEMVYTSRGQEVGRVTMVDQSGKVLVDTLVKPQDPVFDPVTEFSGLTLEDMEKATLSLDCARQMLFQYLNEKSVLVGHGLNGDLKALGIIHSRIIDSSILYAHTNRRPALRNLTDQLLGYQIQNGFGHCSEEDALASLDLVYFALRNPQHLAPAFAKKLIC